MSAGTVGTNRRIRVNGPEGGGNALQGLPPICNMRSPLVPFVRTRADGENRNVVFCVNQLSGGVGAKRGQFGPGNRAGVGQTGGCAKPTPPWWYNNQAIIAAVALLNQFIETATSNDAWLGLIGDHETIQEDHIDGALENDGSTKWTFEPFIGSSYYPNAPPDVKAAADLLNSMQIRGWVNGKYMLHEVGIIGTKIPDNTPNHGLNLRLADRFVIGVFADTCGTAEGSSDITYKSVCDGKTGANSAPFSFFGLGCPSESGACGIGGGSSGWCRWNGTGTDKHGNKVNVCQCTEC